MFPLPGDGGGRDIAVSGWNILSCIRLWNADAAMLMVNVSDMKSSHLLGADGAETNDCVDLQIDLWGLYAKPAH